MDIVKGECDAFAYIKGNDTYPDMEGKVEFYDTKFGGVIVCVEVYGLENISYMTDGENMPDEYSKFYGFHIHEYGDCTIPFDKTGNHYNPNNAKHPDHAGDMPPLLGNNGFAWSVFYDGRISIDEITGKSVVIHSMRDDFKTQPSGDSGEKIGCGVIVNKM